MNKNVYDISIENGKYNLILTPNYEVKCLRNGEEWIDSPPGSKMLIALMDKVERLENGLKNACDALGADISDYYEEH